MPPVLPATVRPACLEADLSWDFVTEAEEHPVAPGVFDASSWLSADFYNPHAVILQLKLSFVASAAGRTGEVIFGLYPQVRARLRIPASALAQNAWLLPREGALLKPMCGADIVRPEEVDSLRLTVLAGPDGERGLWRTPFVFSVKEPAKLVRAASPHSVLIDSLGQFAARSWSGKTRDETEMGLRTRRSRSSSRPTSPRWWGCRSSTPSRRNRGR